MCPLPRELGTEQGGLQIVSPLQEQSRSLSNREHRESLQALAFTSRLTIFKAHPPRPTEPANRPMRRARQELWSFLLSGE